MKHLELLRDFIEILESLWQLLVMTASESLLLKSLIKDGIKIQPRFDAEPKLKHFGIGTMRSEGTSTLQKIKANVRKRSARA